MLSRRAFVVGTAAVGCTALTSAPAPAADPVARPRALIQIFLRGGLDAIYSTNPRTRKEVDAMVDVPYPERAIVSVGSMRIGPLLAPLGVHLRKLAILNGVIGGTVAHETGLQLVQEMRRSFPVASGPGLVGTAGEFLRKDAPLSSVWFQGSFDRARWRRPTGRALVLPMDDDGIGQLAALASSPSRRSAVTAVLKSHLRGCVSSDPCEAERAIAELVERLPPTGIPAISPASAPFRFRRAPPDEADDTWTTWRRLCRDVTFILENRLAPAIFLNVPHPEWDSHVDNDGLQTDATTFFSTGLAFLLDQLAAHRGSDGRTLAADTAIVISSEIGRFPALNALRGKDHFPELPVVFIGPGVLPGQYGDTDRRMASEPISFQTGRPSSGAKDRRPTMDDVGATILRWVGVDDTRSPGYLGEDLAFLHG